MFLQLDGKNLQILNCNLKSFQISQLNYWGFNKNSVGYSGEIDDKGIQLVKLLDYFLKEGLSFTLDDKLKLLYDQQKQNKLEFSKILETGNAYKHNLSKDNTFKKVIDDIKKIPVRQLKDHQLKAATHLYLVKNGANFSVPGSGKTSVVLSVYEKLKNEGHVNTLFVVGPPSCFQPWMAEFKLNLNRTPRYQILAGGNRNSRKSSYFVSKQLKPELILTTFQTLLQDEDDVITFMSRKGMDIYLVIDEAHYIKKIDGNWAKSILNIATHAKSRCVLTGTPMPRGYTDIFNLFDFLWPGNNPLDSTTKIKVKKFSKMNNHEYVKELLKDNIGPLFYRVRKKDLGLKKANFHNPIIIKMNPVEQKIYNLLKKRISQLDKEEYINNIDTIKLLRKGRIIRLRQSISYVKLLLTAIENYNENLMGDSNKIINLIRSYDETEMPAKLEYTLSFTKNLVARKEKVIIWSNFVNTIKLINKVLLKSGIKSKYIIGETQIEKETISDVETREKIIQEFLDQNSGLNVLIANPAACAESISLHTTCHNALYYDLSYNCAQYLQSLDRIHRVGGSEFNDTNYYFLEYENTIDKDILNNIRHKAKRMNDLIDEDYNIYNLDMSEDNDDEQEAYVRLFGKNK